MGDDGRGAAIGRNEHRVRVDFDGREDFRPVGRRVACLGELQPQVVILPSQAVINQFGRVSAHRVQGRAIEQGGRIDVRPGDQPADVPIQRREQRRRPAGAVILPNPNAPTGVALSRAEIATLVEQHPEAPVVIDEAYVDFGAETAIPLVASHANLLVVQTMSKSRALAGLRVGYAIGDAGLIEALTRVKDSFNSYPLGRLAQAGAIASLQDEAWFQQSRARVIEGRERLTVGLHRLGFDVLPSCANFVFARHPAQQGAALAAALRQRAVIVRHFAAPRISDYLRITVGTDAQIEALLSALSDILGSEPAAAFAGSSTHPVG